MKSNKITIMSTPNGKSNYFLTSDLNLLNVFDNNVSIMPFKIEWKEVTFSKQYILSYQKQNYTTITNNIKNMTFKGQLNKLYINLNNIVHCDIEKYPELYDYYVLSKI